jgi:hypothetical protein
VVKFQSKQTGERAAAYPDLIAPARLGEIPHPLDAVVIALLKHLEEAHDEPGRREHQHLEVDVDRRSRPHLPVRRTRQVRGGRQRALLAALQARESARRSAAVRVEGGVKTYFQTTTFSPGTYFALPLATWQSTAVVFSGVGMRRTTFVADSLLLKLALTVTAYETCVVPISVTVGITRRGSLTFEVERYLGHRMRQGTGASAEGHTA